MTPAQLVTYLPQLSTTQLELLTRLEQVFCQWNEKVNLVSRKDAENLTERHLLHSLAIGLHWQPRPGATVLDIGCGGGLPGLPLAILYPEVQFTLLDSIRKKIEAVRAMASELGLTNVQAVWQRAEDHKPRYHYVLGRAVTQLPAFVQLARPHLNGKQMGNLPSGILYLKGGDFSEELEQTRCKYSLHPLLPHLQLEFYETKMLVYLFDCP